MPRSNRLGIHENEDHEHSACAVNFNREAQRRMRLQIDRKYSPILIARLIIARYSSWPGFLAEEFVVGHEMRSLARSLARLHRVSEVVVSGVDLSFG